MAQPISAKSEQWNTALFNQRIPLVHSGKVRDTFHLGNSILLQCATDRLSIFDFVLPTTIPEKGEILTALTVYWLTEVFRGFKHHLLAFGSNIRFSLPPIFSNNCGLQKRALVVEKLKMAPFECIARGYLTGSGWSSYQKDGTVCGHRLPEGLFDGAKLPRPIFTPTTKAEKGHDEHIDAASVDAELSNLTKSIYRKAAAYALERGVILADTKLEFSTTGVLGDEVLTPDSSRFWDLQEWRDSSADKKSPPSYDKQVVREWGKTAKTPWGKGIQTLEPTNKEHLAYVESLPVPTSIIEETSARYHQIFKRLTGLSLKDFQKDVMGITN